MKNTFTRRLALLMSVIGLSLSAEAQQYCTPTESGFSCSFNDVITSFSTTGGATNITNNNSGCNGGYVAGQVHTALQGTTVSFSLTSGTSGKHKIWVDWNGDKDFTDAGEEVFTNNTSATSANGSFLIPANATPGTTRMRIRYTLFDYQGTGFTSCDYQEYGEYEDYDFTITAPPAPQYCTPTESGFSCSSNIIITDFSTTGGYTNITNNFSNCNPGYVAGQEHTGIPGGTVDFSMTSSYMGYHKIWVDWNGDKDFADAGELVYQAGTASSYPYTSTNSFVIPANATLGTTRMRVRFTYNDYYNTGFTSCDHQSYSEYEDYDFTVTNCNLVAGAAVATVNNQCKPSYTTSLSLSGASGATGGYQWQSSADGSTNWADISSATDATYEATVTANTYYRAKLTCDSTSVFSAPVALTLKGPDPFNIGMRLPTGSICYNQFSVYQADLTLNGGYYPGSLTYSWSRTDTTRPAIGSNAGIAYIYDIPKDYPEDISITVTHTLNGCATSATATAYNQQAVPTPNPVVTASGAKNFCEGGSVTLTNVPNVGSAYSFLWEDDYGNTVSTTASYTATASGYYYMTVTDTATGCRRYSSEQIINVRPLPIVSPTANGDLAICKGDNVTLSNSVNEPGVTYRWKRDGLTNVSTTASYTAKTGGSYALTATLSGCSVTSAPFDVTVKAVPNVSVSASGSTALCAGDNVILSAADIAGYTYQWYNGTNPIAGETTGEYLATTAGSYKVAVSNGGCAPKNSAVTKITATNLSASIITQTASSANSVTLRGNNGSVYGYQWYLDGDTIINATSQYYTASQNGTYTLELFRNNCSVMSAPKVISSITNPSDLRMSVAEEEQRTISIYPNPSDGVFNIAANEVVNVIVRDVQGKVVANITNALQVDLTNQPAGMYLMQITDAKGNLLQSERLMKK